MSDRIEFATYVNANQGFQFDYPVDWQVRESSGTEEKYCDVDVLGPIDANGIVRVSVSVTVFPVANQPGRRNLEDVVRDFLKRHRQLEAFQIISRGSRKVDGLRESRLVFSYLAGPFPHKDRDLVQSISESVVFFQSGHRFFMLGLMANQDDFASHKGILNRLLISFSEI